MFDETIAHPVKGRIAIAELEEGEAVLILTSIPTFGISKVRELIRCFGSGKQALQATALEIEGLSGFGPKASEVWKQWPFQENWKQNLLLVAKQNVELVPFSSSNYPKALLDISDAPVLLYVKGEFKPIDQRAIAIVGTRQASIYGLEMARRLAYGLAGLGFTIISGLSRGVDTAAHKGALECGRSIAVIGSGLANIYPTENLALASQMQNSGAILSEFSMGMPPNRLNFPQRNRIVCGMALGTLLIEAPLKSGAMITMEMARQQGKPLFVLPGRADMESFRGNHALIKQGKGHLVEEVRDIADHFNFFFEPLPQKESLYHSHRNFQLKGGIKLDLNAEEQELWNLFPNHEISIEQLLSMTTFPMSKVNGLLMSLVLKGLLKEFPGKLYIKSGKWQKH